jgi:hypothetical protein
MIMQLYDLAGLAIIGWAFLIFFPFWSGTKKLVEWTVFPVLLCAIYLVGIVVVVADTGPGIMADFGNAEGVLGLLTQPDVALIAWIHILAFDHLVAVLIFRDNLTHKVVPLPLQSLILFMTLMFGPGGFLTYWTIRVARGRGTAFGGALQPEASSAPDTEATS